MKLHELQPAAGSRKVRNRVGRGLGSGNGKTAGRGMKGQNSRSGGGVRTGFEGGQMPIYRRLPKRGFKNVWAKTFAEVNVETLNRFEDGTTVDPVVLVESGILKNVQDGIRILGNGELTKKLTVRANGFTKSAEEKITAAGGKVEVIEVLSALGNIFKIPELRQKIIFTLVMFAIFRMGTHIPVPGVDPTAIEKLFANGNLFGLLDLFPVVRSVSSPSSR